MTAHELVGHMLRAHQMGLRAGRRGWATLDDLKLQALDPAVADAYRMGRELGGKERACITPFANCPQMPEEGVTPPPVATNNNKGDQE